MGQFGIKATVMTPHETLEYLRDKLESDPDKSWCDGRGKKFMHSKLKQALIKEDAYFDAHLEEAVSTNQRWIDFMDDCAIFAVLSSVLSGNPLGLLHPSCFGSQMFSNKLDVNKKPSLVHGIPVLN